MRKGHFGIRVNAVTISATVLAALLLGKYILLPAVRLTHGHENLIGFLLGLGAICTCFVAVMFLTAFVIMRRRRAENKDRGDNPGAD